VERWQGTRMIHLLGLLKNPFVKIIADKTIGAISHKLEKDKIIKAKEIEATSKLDIAKVGVQLEQVRQQNNSFKDEWLVVFFTILMACHFIPFTNELCTLFNIVFRCYQFLPRTL
jgi:hypothetical protein